MNYCLMVVAGAGFLASCVARGTYLTMRIADDAARGVSLIRAQEVVAKVVETFDMTEDEHLENRRTYSRENDAYPFEVTQSYEYLTSDDGASVKIYLAVGIEKQTGNFAASIFHSAPFLKTDFAVRLEQALASELAREFPDATLQTESTRAWHILGP